MYISREAILQAIEVLRRDVHPFLGITYVACKHYGLGVGVKNDLSLDVLTKSHLELHHKIDRRSGYYFQPFKSASWWVTEKYPSSGLQTINTQTFGHVFLHERGERKWGFKSNYLDELISTLKQLKVSSRVPADAMAVWLYKGVDVADISGYKELIDLFFEDYKITKEERELLFFDGAMGDLSRKMPFISAPLEMNSVVGQLPDPPDAEGEVGKTIASLRLVNTGPAKDMSIGFGQRLTVITGDNGLGKSFLLDFAWWAATGLWAEKEALPQSQSHAETTPAEVEYALAGPSGKLSKFNAKFDQKNYSWSRARGSMTVEAIAVFSRADGSFAVSDPIRSKFNRGALSSGSLTAYEVWNGRAGVIEGLIRDWVKWQGAADHTAFAQFSSVLSRLSPEDLGTLTPGPTVRLPGDPRDIPTIQHRYGTVPVTHASSGVQRVLLIAYLIIWSWKEHELACGRLSRPALHRMMVVVDELEAHLHPKWQRIVLPALMGIGDLLSADLSMQTIAATHSPMILASLESSFDRSSDALYHLYGVGPKVTLEETPFVKYGDASAWLTSPLFGMRHARSKEAEAAIEDAKRVQLLDVVDSAEVSSISEQLRTYLAPDDKFWPRWLFFAEQHGVKI